MLRIRRLCDRIARLPLVARIAEMYHALPTWQQFLVWFVAITGGFQFPSLVADNSELAESLSPVLILGLFVGQVLLFTWLDDR